MRTLWIAEELSLEYEHIPFEYDDPALKEPAFLAMNPSGAIPTIVDGAVTLSESLAINLYLAKTYGSAGAKPLYPSDPIFEASTWQWSLWAQGQIEPWVQKDEAALDLRKERDAQVSVLLNKALTTLERHLAKTEWLVGDHFTVADLNVANILSPSRARTVDMEGFLHVRSWLTQCYDRPAARAVRERFS